MKRVYRKPDPVAKPDRDFAGELDELCRAKVAELVQSYLEAEVDELLGRLRYERRDGKGLGFRDGHDPERTVTASIGPIAIRRPRVRGVAHESALVPKYRRRLPSIDKTIHPLWIEGLAHRDFEPTLRGLLGAEAPLSASTIARVNAEFGAEYETWKQRRLDGDRYVYLWVDGIHLGAGPADERRVLLVVIGANADGTKHLVALDDAMSESELSWTELFEDLKKRGLHMPQLLIADGANGLWAAASKALPSTRQQRCWLHKVRNVLDKLPEKQKPRVHTELRSIVNAPSEIEARNGIEALAKTLQRDYPKAAACLRDDVDRMVTFYRFPSGSWKSLRTTNPIESIFASVRLRTEAAKRLRTGTSATYLVFKLVQRLSGSWRRINGYQSITLANTEAA